MELSEIFKKTVSDFIVSNKRRNLVATARYENDNLLYFKIEQGSAVFIFNSIAELAELEMLISQLKSSYTDSEDRR